LSLRKRAQIATALFKNPVLLAIDEPSNHLDHYSKKVLFDSLNSYQGIGLLVSHDRDLLDTLCRHTLFVFPPYIDMRKKNYSIAAQEINRETAYQQHSYEITKKEIKKLRKKVIQQREKAKQADISRSKSRLKPNDHDAKSKKDLARLTGKDSVDGRLHRRLKSQFKKAEERKSNLHFTKQTSLGITFNEDRAKIKFPIIIRKNSIDLSSEKR
jgi:macrolide transport system ATP-binding/permease protein